MNREQRQRKRLGTGMLLATWVLVIGMLTWGFSGLLERQWNPNAGVQTGVTEDGRRQVTLERNRQGHYVADGAINDVPVTFLVDTGATHVSVPEGVAERIGLERGAAVTFTTANGDARGYMTWLDRVELGGISVGRVRGSINPGMGGEVVLLGMSFLRELELTQRDGQLIVRE